MSIPISSQPIPPNVPKSHLRNFISLYSDLSDLSISPHSSELSDTYFSHELPLPNQHTLTQAKIIFDTPTSNMTPFPNLEIIMLGKVDPSWDLDFNYLFPKITQLNLLYTHNPKILNIPDHVKILYVQTINQKPDDEINLYAENIEFLQTDMWPHLTNSEKLKNLVCSYTKEIPKSVEMLSLTDGVPQNFYYGNIKNLGIVSMTSDRRFDKQLTEMVYRLNTGEDLTRFVNLKSLILKLGRDIGFDGNISGELILPENLKMLKIENETEYDIPMKLRIRFNEKLVDFDCDPSIQVFGKLNEGIKNLKILCNLYKGEMVEIPKSVENLLMLVVGKGGEVYKVNEGVKELSIIDLSGDNREIVVPGSVEILDMRRFGGKYNIPEGVKVLGVMKSGKLRKLSDLEKLEVLSINSLKEKDAECLLKFGNLRRIEMLEYDGDRLEIGMSVVEIDFLGMDENVKIVGGEGLIVRRVK